MSNESTGNSITSYGVSIPSSTKPVFDRLEWTSSRTHLVIIDGYGVAVLERLLNSDDVPDLSTISVLLCSEVKDMSSLVQHAGGEDVTVVPSEADLLNGLEARLGSATMETHIYVAGDSAFLGKVAQTAYAKGIAFQSLTAEATGPAVRPTQCVHCKGKWKVSRRVYVCPHCHLTLQVRDHYSKRIGAYQAVTISAPEEELDRLKNEMFG